MNPITYILIKISALIVMVYLLVKRYGRYVVKGHLWFDLGIFFYGEKVTGDLDTARVLCHPPAKPPPKLYNDGREFIEECLNMPERIEIDETNTILFSDGENVRMVISDSGGVKVESRSCNSKTWDVATIEIGPMPEPKLIVGYSGLGNHLTE